MPKMSEEATIDLLTFLGWSCEDDKWVHPQYQTKPGDRPDINSDSSFWWITDWLLRNNYSVKFTRSINPHNKKSYCIVKKSDARKKKWTANDFAVKKPTQALLAILLKIKRFPDGQPRKKGEYRQALLDSLKKKNHIPNYDELQEVKRRALDITDKLKKELKKDEEKP